MQDYSWEVRLDFVNLDGEELDDEKLQYEDDEFYTSPKGTVVRFFRWDVIARYEEWRYQDEV